MTICDRCKQKITGNEIELAKRTVTIYSAQGAYICHSVDLCSDCRRLLSDLKDKLESYFMINDDPIAIFKDKKYWDDSRR